MNEEFKKNLLNLMHKFDYTQTDLARSVGVSQSTVNHWCVGMSIPRGATLLKLASTLGVSPSTLLGTSALGTLNEEDKLLHDFRMLSPKGKEKALERMDELKQLYWYNKEGVANA